MITLLKTEKKQSWSFDFRREVRIVVEASEPVDVYVSNQEIEGRKIGQEKAIFFREQIKTLRTEIKLPYSWWWKKGKWFLTVGNLSKESVAVYCYVSVWT